MNEGNEEKDHLMPRAECTVSAGCRILPALCGSSITADTLPEPCGAIPCCSRITITNHHHTGVLPRPIPIAAPMPSSSIRLVAGKNTQFHQTVPDPIRGGHVMPAHLQAVEGPHPRAAVPHHHFVDPPPQRRICV